MLTQTHSTTPPYGCHMVHRSLLIISFHTPFFFLNSNTFTVEILFFTFWLISKLLIVSNNFNLVWLFLHVLYFFKLFHLPSSPPCLFHHLLVVFQCQACKNRWVNHNKSVSQSNEFSFSRFYHAFCVFTHTVPHTLTESKAQKSKTLTVLLKWSKLCPWNSTNRTDLFQHFHYLKSGTFLTKRFTLGSQIKVIIMLLIEILV